MEPAECPLGSYCLTGTERETQFLCPNGTFGGTTKLVNVTMCSTCTAGEPLRHSDTMTRVHAGVNMNSRGLSSLRDVSHVRSSSREQR